MAKIFSGTRITASNLTSSYTDLFPMPALPINELVITSDSNKPVLIQVDGSGDDIRLPAGWGIVIGNLASDFTMQPVVKVKHDGVAPTEGVITAMGLAK